MRQFLLCSGLAVVSFMSTGGCGSSGLPPGAIAKLRSSYNYSPSVIDSGNSLQVWWCGQAPNPTDSHQNTDTILYETYDPVRNVASTPVVTLSETKGAWDSAFTCNPKVVRGVFVNPLGDGQTYTYELFYVATALPAGVDNSIGVAFSDDGMSWKKYPDPVILSTSAEGYGVGLPVPYNADGKSSIVLLYEDTTPIIHHVKAVSSDGVHFTVTGTLTMNGMDPNNVNPSWGDIGYEPSTGYWYAAFQLGLRPAATTGGEQELGQYGLQIFRIPNDSLLTGATPWQMVKTVDTNLTGYESNFLPSLAKDGFGNIVTKTDGQFRLYPSISDPAPSWDSSAKDAAESTNLYRWVIGSMHWDPSQQTVALTRYRNSTAYDVTTGFVDPRADFKADATLGHLYVSPQSGANVPFYGCKDGPKDFVMSLDPGCEGQYILGLEGYGYASQAAGKNLVPLYRCASSSHGHFVSHDGQCEGQGTGTLLGFANP